MEEVNGARSNSAARAVAIVEFLASRPGQTFTLSELARRCGLRKSTAYTILCTLHDAGWLTRSPVDLRYGMGPTLISIGRAAEETRPEVNLARPVMQALSDQFQRECVFSTSMGDDILILESTGSPSLRGRALHPGEQVPLVAPFGTVFVAWQETPGHKEWYRRSGLTIPDRIQELEKILAVTVRRGYVVALRLDPQDRVSQVMQSLSNKLTTRELKRAVKERLSQISPAEYLVGEYAAGVTYLVDSVQAPVFDADGTPRYALTINLVNRELDRDALAELGGGIRAAADEITAAIAAHGRQRWTVTG